MTDEEDQIVSCKREKTCKSRWMRVLTIAEFSNWINE